MRKEKTIKRKRNYGVPELYFQEYLNLYYNPNCDHLLEEFYRRYFKKCSHQNFEKKLHELQELCPSIGNGKHELVEIYQNGNENATNSTLFKEVLLKFKEELTSLCEHAKTLEWEEIEPEEILRGNVVLIKDRKRRSLYYQTPNKNLKKLCYELQTKKLTR